MIKNGIHIEVVATSISSVNRSIDAMQKGINNAAIKVVGKAGFQINRDTKRNAPVDFGFLRASVYIDHKHNLLFNPTGVKTVGKNGQTRTNFEIPQTPAQSSRDGLDVIVGSPLHYADKQNQRTKFLTDAFNKTKDKVGPEIDKVIDEEIKKAGMK